MRQVLAYARGGEGDRVPVSVGPLVPDVRKLLSSTVSRSIEILVSIPEGPCALLGDATKIHQGLMNLCVNARDAMPEGGTLTIALEKILLDAEDVAAQPDCRPSPDLVIRVADTGPGIPPEVLEKIFDPFFTTKDVGKGTGLLTSASIVKGMGGSSSSRPSPPGARNFPSICPRRIAKQAVSIEEDGNAFVA